MKLAILVFILWQAVRGLKDFYSFASRFEICSVDFELFQGGSRYEFGFRAFERNFNVSAWLDREVFSKGESRLEEDLGDIKVIKGRLADDVSSLVSGFLQPKGARTLFTGSIVTEQETFFLEPARRFSNATQHKDLVIIYKASDTFGFHHGGDGALAKSPGGSNFISKIENIKFSSNAEEVTGKVPVGKICMVELLSSYSFFEANGGDRNEVIAIMLIHLNSANAVFQSCDFDQDGVPDNISFSVQRFTVMEDPASDLFSASLSNNATDILSLCSLRQQLSCLLVCFVDRALDHKVIGLAYKSEVSSGVYGGICQTPLWYGGSFISTNSIVVSSRIKGRRLPLSITSRSLMHELGHSFGSDHDSPSDPVCSPRGKRGKFIMAPEASNGDKPNNKLFSPCSLASMRTVIATKGSCLKPFYRSFCGNGRREDDEECDCGTADTCELLDPCCTPMGFNGTRGCTLRDGAQCSHQPGSCCTRECRFVSAEAQQPCYSGHPDCTRPSVCDGRQGVCPHDAKLQDGTACRNRSRTCRDGLCDGTVCRDEGLEDCECPNDRCRVCCLAGSTCVPADDIARFPSVRWAKEPGSECPQGRCSSDGRCVSPSGFKIIGQWLSEYVVIVVIVVSGAVIGIIAITVFIRSFH